ncbi:hypothetical protein FHX14_004517 [Rhizobium sp. BK619]|uniref:hypothetical protein n=1 Tax=Rhizobium sp. BK619 TaxID=2586989 RepID=UPI00181C7C95|nr:hypothetical protein [Rhizobium sp. BK619]MBB3648292.1 hypothetical protein [Rhizobium sp. BK619]
MPKFAFAVIVTVIAVSKVRLVVLDFLGERQHRSPIGPALIAWASAVLAIALTKALISEPDIAFSRFTSNIFDLANGRRLGLQPVCDAEEPLASTNKSSSSLRICKEPCR